MSSQEQSETLLGDNHPDVLPLASQTPYHSVAAMAAGGLSKADDLTKWPRAPAIREFDQMADLIIASGIYGVEGSSTDYGYQAIMDIRH